MAIEDYFLVYMANTLSFPMHASKLKAMQIKKHHNEHTSRLTSNSFSKNFLSARISNWENGNFFFYVTCECYRSFCERLSNEESL